MCIRLGGIFVPIVYDVIVTSSTIPFSAIQCCEISIFSQTSRIPYKLSIPTKIAGIVGNLIKCLSCVKITKHFIEQTVSYRPLKFGENS